jgi:hypothetical protein
MEYIGRISIMKIIKCSLTALMLAFTIAFAGCDVCDFTEPIEMNYADRGSYNTTNSSIPGYELFYPSNLVGGHPIITWGNGTFAVPSIYGELLDHFASWGFVVIASTSTMTGTGEEMLEGVEWLIDENSREESIFLGKLDIDNIGATGHSQGGGGTINAGTDPRVKCTAPIEPIPGDVENLHGPMFLIGGESDCLVRVSGIMSNIYDPSPVPTIFGIASCANHFTAIGDAGMFRGYLTAWFCGELMGHEYAQDAFYDPCEICNNVNWTLYRKNL